MQKYISNLNKIFNGDAEETSDLDLNQQNDESKLHGQELRQNFFLKAFEIYLEKVLSKNQEKMEKSKTITNSKSKHLYEDEDDNQNLPENLRNVQRIIKQRKKQKKLMGSSRIDKFEKKMEIFKDLHSFVDIKSFLLESNVANYNNSEELLVTLKTHYKDGLNMVLSEEKTPKVNRNSKNVYTYSPRQIPLKDLEEPIERTTLEQKMKKYKEIIDLSKETVTHAVRKNSYVDEGISKDLYSHLSKKFKVGNKTFSNGNEEANRDNKFNESLENLESRFIYAQKYLQAPLKKGKNTEYLSEDQKLKQKKEVEQLDTVIKRTLLKGVVGEDGGPSTNEYYLNEYKTQYDRIKKILQKVTKNIFRKDIKVSNEKVLNPSRMSSFTKVIQTQTDSDNKIPSLKSGFLTEIDKNPYLLNDRKNSTSFIRKNILEVEKLNSTKNNFTETQKKEMLNPLNSDKRSSIQLPTIISHLQEKRGSSFEPYFLKSDSLRSIPNDSASSTGRSYKKENRVIHKRFDHFLKAISRVETTQKFLSDDLKENMGEMAKEMNKLNVETSAEQLQSIRDLDPTEFKRVVNVHGMRKTMKRISNLKL